MATEKAVQYSDGRLRYSVGPSPFVEDESGRKVKRVIYMQNIGESGRKGDARGADAPGRDRRVRNGD